ncbi:MAG: exodeoxyribonuclease VII large subunit, partial [Lachnospiraceae bacterium]
MNKVYSVKQINSYIKNIFNKDVFLSSLFIKGEVSNLKYHSSGHIYFSMKDESSSISCVMFAPYRRGLTFNMENGDKIVASGNIDVFERSGQYQLYVKEIQKEGSGDLYARFLKLKNTLKDMGMFDSRYKKKINKFNTKIGVVTAPTGAAIRDIQNISSRRNPFVQIYLYPALVQGDGACDSICRGIRVLDGFGVDVIIVGRGGGSVEDLWAFNEEAVAKAVFASSTPVISAVGHETDVTISDYVADLRAPTPSAAAELAVFDYNEFCGNIDYLQNTFTGSMRRKINNLRSLKEYFEKRFYALNPRKQMGEQKLRLVHCRKNIERAMTQHIEYNKKRAEDLSEKLSKETFGYIERDRSRITEFSRSMAENIRYICILNEKRRDILIERYKGISPLDRLKQGFAYVS